jgi:cytochrome c oxidase subunit 1
MPRRVYQYDAGQGLELFNLLSTAGTVVLIIGTTFLLVNLLKCWRGGERASSNPWGAATLEWSIPSPPPDYNFAVLPQVKSRYPLWNVKGGDSLVHETTWDEEKNTRIPTSKELGIVMPNPSIWPLICATGLIVMFSGLLFMDASVKTAMTVMLLGSACWIGSLYKWLLTPLEDHH